MKLFITLLALQAQMTDQRHIKVVSVSANGVITIVFDCGLVTPLMVEDKMKEAGITEYTMTDDWNTDSIFVKIKGK